MRFEKRRKHIRDLSGRILSVAKSSHDADFAPLDLIFYQRPILLLSFCYHMLLGLFLFHSVSLGDRSRD